jgi:hypothetical protein
MPLSRLTPASPGVGTKLGTFANGRRYLREQNGYDGAFKENSFCRLGRPAKLERSLIVERVRAGLRNARAKGRTLGKPRKIVDAARIAALRAQGLSLRSIASELGVGVATLHRASAARSKIQ